MRKFQAKNNGNALRYGQTVCEYERGHFVFVWYIIDRANRSIYNRAAVLRFKDKYRSNYKSVVAANDEGLAGLFIACLQESKVAGTNGIYRMSNGAYRWFLQN